MRLGGGPKLFGSLRALKGVDWWPSADELLLPPLPIQPVFDHQRVLLGGLVEDDQLTAFSRMPPPPLLLLPPPLLPPFKPPTPALALSLRCKPLRLLMVVVNINKCKMLALHKQKSRRVVGKEAWWG